MGLRFAIDTGGTFTDLVVTDEKGALGMFKASTVPGDPAAGVIDSLRIAAEHGGESLADYLARGEMLVSELVRRTQDIAIHVVTREAEALPQPASAPRKGEIAPLPFLYAALAVAAALAVGKGLTALTPIPNLSMVFMLSVLLIAVSFGVWPAVFASFLSFLVYNFFFIPPLYTFTIAEPFELLALVIFLIVAIISSALAGRVRQQATVAAARMRATRRLYEFTRRLSGLAGRELPSAPQEQIFVGRCQTLASDRRMTLRARAASRSICSTSASADSNFCSSRSLRTNSTRILCP